MPDALNDGAVEDAAPQHTARASARRSGRNTPQA